MEWITIATLVAQYGIPFVEFLIQKIETKGTVTADEWAQLKQLASVNARAEMLDRLKAAGIDPASPQGLALLNLVSASPGLSAAAGAPLGIVGEAAPPGQPS